VWINRPAFFLHYFSSVFIAIDQMSNSSQRQTINQNPSILDTSVSKSLGPACG